MNEQEIREELLKIQVEKERNVLFAQKIVLENIERAIDLGESATVAAMADILKI